MLAEAAAAGGIGRFVHLSAIGADPASASGYGRSKAGGEAAVRQAFPQAVVLRPSVVFGPDDSFFNRFAAMAAVSPVLPLIGGGATRFQPVYVGDVAAAAVAALADPVAAGKTFELGGPEIYSFEALMRLMLGVVERRPRLVKVSFGLAETLGAMGDALSRLGIAPPLTRDQVEMLRADNVVAPGAPGLAELGVAATAVEAIIPTYLWRYRKGGQYAEAVRASVAASR